MTLPLPLPPLRTARRALLATALLPAAAFPAPPPVPPTAAPERRVTLAEALELARTASPRLAQLRAQDEAARAGVEGARADRGPSVTLSGAYSRNSNVPEFIVPQPDGTSLVVFPNLPNQAYARVGLAQPVYTGGRLSAALDGASAQQLAAAQDTQAGQADLRLEVTVAYWNLVAGRASEQVLRETITSYEVHLKDATNREAVGMAARNEVLAVQVQRDRAELGRLQEENGAAVENANLARLLGLPPRTRVVPVEEEAPTDSVGEADLEAFVAEGLQKRPELAALRARLAAAEAQVKIAKAASLPQASVSGTYDYASPNQRIFPLAGIWRDTWALGLSVSFTAFDNGRTSAAVARARAQLDSACAQIRDLEERVRLEVTTRLAERRTAIASLAVASRGMESAREDLRVTQDRYRAGVTPSSDLLDAETRLLQVGLDRTLAAANVQVAEARLDRSRGR